MGNTNSSSSSSNNRNSGSVNVSTPSESASGTPPRSLRVRSSAAAAAAQQGSSSSSSSAFTGGSRLGGISSRDRSSRSRSKAAGGEDQEGAAPPQPPLFPQEARVDNGHLLPLSNVYPNAAQDWLRDTVQSLIVERKLAPFYRGLEDYDGEDAFDRDELDKVLDEVGDERAKLWRRTLYSDADRKAEASMYKKASECPICFL